MGYLTKRCWVLYVTSDNDGVFGGLVYIVQVHPRTDAARGEQW